MAAAAAKAGAKYLGAALGLVLLGIFFAYFFDYNAAMFRISGASRTGLACAVASLVGAMCVRCVKWTYIVRTSTRIGWAAGFHVTFAANMMNFLFPVRLGELVRLYLAKSVAAVPYSTSVSATLIDRSSGLLTLMLCFGLYPAAGFTGIDATGYWWAFALVGAAAVVLLLFGDLIGRNVASAAGGVLSALRVPGSRIERLVSSRPATFFAQTLVNCHLPRYGWRVTGVVFALSFLFLIGDALALYFLMNAFELPLSAVQAVVAASVFNLAFVLPSPPGQIGTAEMLPVLVFAYGFGLPRDVVASSALTWHLLSAAVILALGGYSTYRLGPRLAYRT